MAETPEGSLTCARVRVLIEPFVDGDLATTDPKLAAAVKHHLATCDDCRRQYHQAVSLPFRLKALSSPLPRKDLIKTVMSQVATTRQNDKRAWTLLAPEAILAALILWYLSGLQGLATIASGVYTDLLSLTNWGTGGGSLPSIPAVDILFLIALIALTATAAYHISVLARLDTASTQRPSRLTGRIARD
jgi:predicted anti-sigma-YlaC factor YlaD